MAPIIKMLSVSGIAIVDVSRDGNSRPKRVHVEKNKMEGDRNPWAPESSERRDNSRSKPEHTARLALAGDTSLQFLDLLFELDDDTPDLVKASGNSRDHLPRGLILMAKPVQLLVRRHIVPCHVGVSFSTRGWPGGKFCGELLEPVLEKEQGRTGQASTSGQYTRKRTYCEQRTNSVHCPSFAFR